MADLVSVVIPVYNTDERFAACFESVLKQEYKDIEVILVDDGSSDTSAQRCDMLAKSTDSFPVMVVHKRNGGVSRARNLGIDFAGGKYIVFIDSDDQVTPNYISDFMNAREKYPDAGHIWCGFEHVSTHKRYIFSGHESISLVNRDDFFELAEKVLTQSPCLRIYDVLTLKSNKIKMIENLSLAEDVLFNLEYLDAVPSKQICIINSPNYIYINSNEDSLNFKYRDNLEEIYTLVLDRLLAYTTRWGLIDSESITKYYNVLYYKHVEILRNTFHPNNKISYLEKIRYNNQVLHSESFIKALSTMSVALPKRLRKAYKTKNYFFVWLIEHMTLMYR